MKSIKYSLHDYEVYLRGINVAGVSSVQGSGVFNDINEPFNGRDEFKRAFKN